jgi:uncharacterized protein YjcR
MTANPNDRRDQIRTMYLAGHSLRAIARELGISHQAVHATLRRLAVPRRPRGGNQFTGRRT